ncbi:MAG TPA: hypothetical protein DCW68_06815 [Rhodospirillaceae bacterium]|nr:MAG: hypothetical protein A2018_01325 [Alphaproteobacteria bacterium GWF2_58_20]HAU29799.1 hypothetical protein [Rhodospirillaceae bacterium]
MARKKALIVEVDADTDKATDAVRKFAAGTEAVGNAAVDAAADVDKLGAEAGKTAQEVAEEEKKAAKKLENVWKSLGAISNEEADNRRKKVVDQFDEIKKSGKYSAEEIQRAWARAQEKLDRIDASVGKQRFSWARLATSAKASIAKITGGLTKIGSSVLRVTRFARNMALAFTAAVSATGYAIFRIVKSSAEYTDEIGKMSIRTGIATEALSALRAAAEQSDISFQEIEVGLKKYNQALAASGRPGKTDPFKDIGVNTRTANGQLRGTVDILKDVFDAIKKIPDAPSRVAAALRIFGERGGNSFLTMIDQGSKGLAVYEAAVKRLGLEVTADMARHGQQFNDALDTMGKAWQGVKLAIGEKVVAQFIDLFGRITDSLADNRDKIADILGGISSKFVQVFQDIVAMIQGKDGDVQNKWLIDMRDRLQEIAPSWDDIKSALDRVGPALKATANAMMTIADWVGKAVDGVKMLGDVLKSPLVNPISAWMELDKKAFDVGSALYNQIKTGSTDGTGWKGGTLSERLPGGQDLTGTSSGQVDNRKFILAAPAGQTVYGVSSEIMSKGQTYDAMLTLNIAGEPLLTATSKDKLDSWTRKLTDAERRAITQRVPEWSR